MNPCPCGFYGDNLQSCSCSSSSIVRYRNRLSGPLLDRIDIHVEVPRVEYDKLSGSQKAEPSKSIRRRIEAARERQRDRFAGSPKIKNNAEMGPADVKEHCELDSASEGLMKSAMQQLKLSARGFHRVLKAGAHDRRPVCLRTHRGRPSGRGAAIPAEADSLTIRARIDDYNRARNRPHVSSQRLIPSSMAQSRLQGTIQPHSAPVQPC